MDTTQPPEGRLAHRPTRLLAAFLPVLGLLVLTAGCGGGGPQMGSVSGTVTYQGSPVKLGTITFVAAKPDGRNATGMLSPEGEYTLQTEEPADGALVGDYTVTISARETPVLDYIPKKAPPIKYLAPAKYENPATSTLKASVKAGSNTLDFPLE